MRRLRKRDGTTISESPTGDDLDSYVIRSRGRCTNCKTEGFVREVRKLRVDFKGHWLCYLCYDKYHVTQH